MITLSLLLFIFYSRILHFNKFFRILLNYIIFILFEKYVLCYPFFGFTYHQVCLIHFDAFYYYLSLIIQLNSETKDVEYMEAVRQNGLFLRRVLIYDLCVMYASMRAFPRFINTRYK